jgi:hypothetical protein
MHPYQFKGQCIRDATMFIFKFNINRIRNFSIALLTLQFVIKTVLRLIQIQVQNINTHPSVEGIAQVPLLIIELAFR